jgi:hypothetical protein
VKSLGNNGNDFICKKCKAIQGKPLERWACVKCGNRNVIKHDEYLARVSPYTCLSCDKVQSVKSCVINWCDACGGKIKEVSKIKSSLDSSVYKIIMLERSHPVVIYENSMVLDKGQINELMSLALKFCELKEGEIADNNLQTIKYKEKEDISNLDEKTKHGYTCLFAKYKTYCIYSCEDPIKVSEKYNINLVHAIPTDDSVILEYNLKNALSEFRSRDDIRWYPLVNDISHCETGDECYKKLPTDKELTIPMLFNLNRDSINYIRAIKSYRDGKILYKTNTRNRVTR